MMQIVCPFYVPSSSTYNRGKRDMIQLLCFPEVDVKLVNTKKNSACIFQCQ